MSSAARQSAAEALGTFALVFAGTAAIVVNQTTGGVITHPGVALTFGLIVFAMVGALGDVSGAHLNPAVSIGFWCAKRVDGHTAIRFIASQCVGAILASLLVRGLFPDSKALGGTLPAGSAMQSFVLELLLTAGLMFVVLNVSTGAKEKGLTAGLVVGGMVALEAMFAGPISGASMNPARSLGPALVSWNLSSLWIYLIAPPLGAMIAVVGCRCIREGDGGCCTAKPGIAT